MKKNKKNGFTLIELIAAMALLAILSTVVLVNMVGIKHNQEEAQSVRFENDIEEAACTYIDMSTNSELRQRCKSDSSRNECKIKLDTLISDSVALIEPDLFDPLTNKKAIEEKDDIYVQIKWENKSGYKEKKCEMKRN